MKSPRNTYVPRHGLWFRLVTWLMIVTQTGLPYVGRLLAVQPDVALPRSPQGATVHPVPVLTPQHVTVNRTLPRVSPASHELRFSALPTDDELTRARVFSVPLVSAEKPGTPAENLDLAQALKQFRSRLHRDDASALEQFLETHPTSRWRLSLLANLGSHYRATLQFSKAIAAWREVWAVGKAIPNGPLKETVDQAAGEWVRLLVTLGFVAELEAIVQELDARPARGAAHVWIEEARMALNLMKRHPEHSFKCGPFALLRVRAQLQLKEAVDPLILEERANTNGTSLTQLCKLAQSTGMNYQMALRQAGAEVPLPCVVHWKVGHFSALTRKVGGYYLVEDGNFHQDWVSPEALDQEGSGYFLVPGGPLASGWETVRDEEGLNAWGRSVPKQPDWYTPDPCSGGRQAGGYSAGGPGTKPCKGMAAYTMDLLRAGLVVADVPVGYTPPVGPEVEFRLSYNERDVTQPGTFTFSNLGKQWSHEWMAWVADNTTTPAADVTLVSGNGASELYSDFDAGAQAFALNMYSQNSLFRTSDTSYERRHPDGSSEVYSVPDNTNGTRRVFLSARKDAAGNALNFTYDSNYRLVAVADAIGQVTTLSYELTNAPLLITQVTDPFGRSARLAYNSSGQLTNITDVLNLSSGFTYRPSSDFVDSLVTPYGLSRFTNYLTGSTRWIEATDPSGQKERAGNDAQPFASYFYNKKAMAEAPDDPSQAEVTQWLAYYDMIKTETYIPHSKKKPLEGIVWYSYPGQATGYFTNLSGTCSQPAQISRLLDDGTTQLYQFGRNALGKATNMVDPSGRTTFFTYATNQIDLLEVRQQVGTNTELQAQFTYNSQHLPLTMIEVKVAMGSHLKS